MRHHYWHLGPNADVTLRFHEHADFAYDTSIAFNDIMGFRRSVAFPYNPWSESKQAPVETVQIPTFLMDGNLFYNPVKVSTAVEKIMKQIEIIKTCNGVGVIDWHVRTSLPLSRDFKEWGQAYVEVLHRLSSDKKIWVTRLSDIYRYIRDRWAKVKVS